MRQTSFATLDAPAPNPSMGASSTANEYLNFLCMLINNGVYNGIKVLREEAIKEMRTIQTQEGQIKSEPKAAEGMPYTLGSWAVETNGKEANASTSSGLLGPIAIVDWCRGYAFVLFSKALQNEQRKEPCVEMAEAVNDRLHSK